VLKYLRGNTNRPLMIPYELAKQLKDAGFLQLGKGGALFLDPRADIVENEADRPVSSLSWETYCHLKRPHGLSEAIYAPTLEELIEACGDKFWSLERDLDPDEIWGAYPANEIGDGPATFGSTPAEAVARLWLALHSK